MNKIKRIEIRVAADSNGKYRICAKHCKHKEMVKDNDHSDIYFCHLFDRWLNPASEDEAYPVLRDAKCLDIAGEDI